MSIVVEVTDINVGIYHQLLDLDKEFQKAETEEEEQAIVKMALKLCEKLEVI